MYLSTSNTFPILHSFLRYYQKVRYNIITLFILKSTLISIGNVLFYNEIQKKRNNDLKLPIRYEDLRMIIWEAMFTTVYQLLKIVGYGHPSKQKKFW